MNGQLLCIEVDMSSYCLAFLLYRGYFFIEREEGLMRK
jgi:hypothetical protein